MSGNEDAIELVIATQAGLDPRGRVATEPTDLLREASQAACLLVGARLRHRSPCRTGEVVWLVQEDALTFETRARSRVVPALVCAATEAMEGAGWGLWEALWDSGNEQSKRHAAGEVLALLTAEVTAC